MAGFLTDYANNKVLDLIFGAAAFAPPSNLYFGLSMNGSNKAGSVGEPQGGGYARATLANNAANFPGASGGTKSNAAVIVFPAPTADWGTVRSFFVADGPTGGNVLAMADLALPKSISAGGASAKVALGALFLSHT